MNVAQDQTIILSLQISVDHRSLSSIDQKICHFIFLSFRLSVFYLAILVHISLSLFKNQSKTPIEISTLKQELESDDDDHAMRESNLVFLLIKDSGGDSWCPWYIIRISTLLQSWILSAERSQSVSHWTPMEVVGGSTQINPRPVYMIRAALLVRWHGIGWLS